jgi:hypothetical protein
LGPFTAKVAEDAKEEKGFPLIHTDDTDRKSVPLIDADERGLETEESSKVVTMRM